LDKVTFDKKDKKDDEMNIYEVKPGIKFWSYIANANEKVQKPRIFIPQTYVNVATNT
jgi:hypothetical protein